MSLARYAASNPLRVLPLPCLELSHPDWSAPHRRVIQPGAWTVTIDGVPTEFPGWHQAGPWLSEYPATNDSGRAGRTLSLDDPFNELAGLIESVRESVDSVRARLWLFRSDQLDVPMIRERYKVRRLRVDDGRLQLDCVSRDLSLITDPWIRHTTINSPGLRGR